MEPTLEDGAMVELEPAGVLWFGDIVAVGVGDEVRVHRFLGYAPWRWRLCVITRPDRGRTLDPPQPPRAVLGRVRSPVALITRAGCALEWLQLALPRRWRIDVG